MMTELGYIIFHVLYLLFSSHLAYLAIKIENHLPV